MKRIFSYLMPFRAAIALEMVIKVLGTLAELLLPWMLQVILDEFVPAKQMDAILLWGGGMVLCAAAGLVFNIIANRMSTGISRQVTQRIRFDLFRRVLGLSSAQVDGFTTPSLISRLTSDTYHVHEMIDRMQRMAVRAPIMLLGGVAMTLFLDPVLACVLVLPLPFMVAGVWALSRQGIRLYTSTQTAVDGMVRRAQESMAGIRVIQALSKVSYESERFDSANRETADREYRAGLLMNATNPLINAILNAGLTGVIVVGALRVNAGSSQPGAIIAFLSYFTMILNALMAVSRIFVMLSKGIASGRRVAEVLQAPSDMEVLPIPRAPDDAHITFEGVSFSYGKAEKDLYNVSFSLQPGQTLGIIGPTGCGKSTLLRLLLRAYDPDAGRILIHSRDLRSIPAQELHKMFGVVFQNDFLFGGTLADNIDFGRDLGRDALQKAAQNAQAEFIETRPGGLDGHIAARGSDLSGGQKQRVLLSRAMAGSPEILILDDSSSALDYKTDAALRRALAHEFAGVTKVIVAQRVSAIRHADCILMLDEPEEAPDAPDASVLDPAAVRGEVTLTGVDFGYTPDRPVLHGLNLTARPGQTIAVVGPTGAGKTTIINLLMRFYDPDGGTITVDGHDIRTLTRASLRRAYSMVLQDTWLFTGTIYENLAYGKPGVTRQEVMDAARAAHIHRFILSLPNGYDTVLQDGGANISKGQRQLLTIARAMLLDAPMLILDEATSNVDTATEQRIQKAMLTLMQGRTCFVIAHRLSTIQNADQILLLQNGCVAEQGTHAELLAKGGAYYALYRAQFEDASAG